MAYRFDLHLRLEAVHTVHDLKAVEAAVRAEVHDPAWFLGRQWQLGEHRGTDAASPGLVHVSVTETPRHRPVRRARGRPADHTAGGRDRVRAGAVVDDRPARTRRACIAQRRAGAAANQRGLAAPRTRPALRRAQRTGGTRRACALPLTRRSRPNRRPVRRARRPRDRARR